MLSKIFIFVIKIYQLIFSPDKGVFKTNRSACRFWPTCSDYSIQAIEKIGALKGSWLAAKRILRCHPFCEGGYDPVK